MDFERIKRDWADHIARCEKAGKPVELLGVMFALTDLEGVR